MVCLGGKKGEWVHACVGMCVWGHVYFVCVHTGICACILYVFVYENANFVCVYVGMCVLCGCGCTCMYV